MYDVWYDDSPAQVPLALTDGCNLGGLLQGLRFKVYVKFIIYVYVWEGCFRVYWVQDLCKVYRLICLCIYGRVVSGSWVLGLKVHIEFIVYIYLCIQVLLIPGLLHLYIRDLVYTGLRTYKIIGTLMYLNNHHKSLT